MIIGSRPVLKTGGRVERLQGSSPWASAKHKVLYIRVSIYCVLKNIHFYLGGEIGNRARLRI